MPAATVFVACLIGFRLNGVDGACIGGSVALLVVGLWTALLPAAWVKDLLQRFDAAAAQRAEMIKSLEEVRSQAASIRRMQAGRGSQGDYAE
jgi:hypothetical protein